MNTNVRTLLKSYQNELNSLKIKEERVEDFCGLPGLDGLEDSTKQLNHIKWMIGQLLESEDWSDRKINRWLGFIQGVMWCNKLKGILQMRDESRHLYD